MEPRILARTHYQVDEPAYVGLLITECTSPVVTEYKERVANRFADVIRRRGRDFNTAAAGYAVDLVRGVGGLSDQHAWTPLGHLINLISERQDGPLESQLTLGLAERLLHFRLFVDADGAALSFLADRVMNAGPLDGRTPPWNELATEMFEAVYSHYAALASMTADRVRIRQQLERVTKSPYAGRTGAHKVFLHLQTMSRLGLIDVAATGDTRRYEAPRGPGRTPLSILLNELPSLEAVDDLGARRGWFSLAARVFKLPHESKATPRALLSDVAAVYNAVNATGTPLCPLDTVIQAIQIRRLATEKGVVDGEEILESLQGLQRSEPRQVRFHVDRTGKPAFLKLSDEILRELAAGESDAS